MMNWRTATVLLGLSSLLACAKATYDGEDPYQAAGGAPADNGGAPSDEGGAPATTAGAAPVAGAPTGGAGAPAHAGATSTGGRSGGTAGATSTGGRSGGTAGATGTAGKGSGGSPGAGGAGVGGGSGGAAAGACDNPTEIKATNGTNGNSGSIGAAAACFSTSAKFTFLGCSNFTGRTLTVNGDPFTCSTTGSATAITPTQIDGFTYFAVSAGGMDYASFFFY